ncbi:MAG: hypothetical protein A2Y37_06685 [Spirochaetes bacterium GWB1_60_80]|nr:MAG: hypothetical protein A2Y37_06685 [Spirochaetes bacterium GWB1_60_80]
MVLVAIAALAGWLGACAWPQNVAPAALRLEIELPVWPTRLDDLAVAGARLLLPDTTAVTVSLGANGAVLQTAQAVPVSATRFSCTLADLTVGQYIVTVTASDDLNNSSHSLRYAA